MLYFKTYSLLTTLFAFYTYIRTLLCVSLCTKNYYSSNQVYKAAPHNSKRRCGEREVQAAKQKAQIILCVLSSIFATQIVLRSRSSGA